MTNGKEAKQRKDPMGLRMANGEEAKMGRQSKAPTLAVSCELAPAAGVGIAKALVLGAACAGVICAAA